MTANDLAAVQGAALVVDPPAPNGRPGEAGAGLQPEPFKNGVSQPAEIGAGNPAPMVNAGGVDIADVTLRRAFTASGGVVVDD